MSENHNNQEFEPLKSWWHFLASGFGAGLAPKAPGTAGSFMALLFIPFLQRLSDINYLVFVVAVFFIGVFVCNKLNIGDNGSIVIDEFVGMWITLFLVPDDIVILLLGFVIFRFFDIYKPFFIKTIDQKMQNGWGIMLDDVLAGIYSFAVLHIVLMFVY